MRILIAEDDPLMLKAIQTRLNSDGYQTAVASDGQEALKILEEFNPDLIITDILMPYTSGLELIGVVKSNHFRKIPVLVLSAYGQENTVLEAFDLGADDFLTKPFNPLELSTRVKRLLKGISNA